MIEAASYSKPTRKCASISTWPIWVTEHNLHGGLGALTGGGSRMPSASCSVTDEAVQIMRRTDV